MWQPTHVKVTVKQARNLISKGKNGTNDAFVIIGIGKEKYQTSLKEKASSPVEWREECELAIPSQGNKATIQLTVYHKKGLSLEDFLGQIALPLTDFDVYEKPKYRSYRLKGKPEKDKKKGEKERGELEVMVNFTVKSESFLEVNKKEKHKSSISSLKHLGGSLMSIGSKEKQGLKNFAKSVSSKMDKITKPRKSKKKIATENSSAFPSDLMTSQQYYGHADPGVISDDEDNDDFTFEDDVKINTRTSSPMSTMSRGSSLAHEQVLDTDYEVGSYEDPEQDISCSLGLSPPKPPRIVDQTKESFSPSGVRGPPSERVTSFFDAKPSFRGEFSPEISQTIIEEEATSIEDREEEEVPSYSLRTSKSKTVDLPEPAIDMSFNIIEPVPVKRKLPLSEQGFSSPKTIVKDPEPEPKPRKKFLLQKESEIAREKPKLVEESPSFQPNVVSTPLEPPQVLRSIEVPKESSCEPLIFSKGLETDSKIETQQEGIIQDEAFHRFQNFNHRPESKPEFEEQKAGLIQETSPLKVLPKETEESIQSILGSTQNNSTGDSSFLSAQRSEEFRSPFEDRSFISCGRLGEASERDSSPKERTDDSTVAWKDVEDIAVEGGTQDIVWLNSFVEDVAEVNVKSSSLQQGSRILSSPIDDVEVSPHIQEENRDAADSAIFLDNDQESILSSRPHSTSNASSVLSLSSTSDLPLKTQPLSESVIEDDKRSTSKPFVKSSSDVAILLRHGSSGRKLERSKYDQSAADSPKTFHDDDSGPTITRSGSLNEKRSPSVAATPTATMATVQPQPTIVDEWERKLYGRSGFTGSTENMSISGSRSSLNTSRESSVHDVRKEGSFTRLPEVKALTLERSTPIDITDDSKRPKKQKQKISLKSRLFSKVSGSRERLHEEGRFVEGGNDRMPSIPTRSSKLPQEIHDKFAGRSREDLLEMILNLQSNLDKQAKHSNDLENYIDNLLLRVMEATPHILQAPIETGKAFKGY